MAPHPRTIDLSLGRIERLLAALGHPERRIPPVIHVAGTNGKGSVVAYLRAMFEAAGLRVHAYTSPHLVRFHERIRLAGKLISERELAAVLAECEKANAGEPITFFEITTAAAFLAFSRHAADVTLLEVGLGGRLDATNVIARPRISVITPVSLDHQHFLGNGLAAIAGEKAGILKRGVPAVIGPQHAIATRVIAAAARKAGSPLIRFGEDFDGRRTTDGRLEFRDDDGLLHVPAPALPGRHQFANAALAMAAARAFGEPKLTDTALARGITAADWPARLQKLGRGKESSRLARRGFEVWLDGGHNPHAGRALGRVLAGWRKERPARPVYLVCGMIRTKDPAGFLAPLMAHVAGVIAVPVPDDHAGIPAQDIAAIARRLGRPARTAANIKAAVDALLERKAGQVLVAGSLYLAGAVLAAEGAAHRPR